VGVVERWHVEHKGWKGVQCVGREGIP